MIDDANETILFVDQARHLWDASVDAAYETARSTVGSNVADFNI